MKMANNNFHPNNMSSGGHVSSSSIGGNSSRSSMYLAFEDYERQARQRKYQIAEYEDSIENLKKELKAVTEKNKALEADCEKMEIAAQAAEEHYEKKVKEKKLLENQCQELSKEMDDAMDEVNRQKERLKSLKLIHHEKVEQAKKLHERHMNEYMKTPRIAKLIEKTKEADDFEAILKEKKQELERKKREHQVLRNKHKEEWDMFKKKCVKFAEIRTELGKKLELRGKLDSKYQQTAPASTPPRSIQMAETSPRKARDPFPLPSGPRGIGNENKITSPRQRSSTFQNLNRILHQSHAVLGSKNYQRVTPMGSSSGGSNWKAFCSPMRHGSTLVSQLKSKLKGTVTVHPMPRNVQVEKNSSQSANTANIATIIPTPCPFGNEARAINTAPPTPIQKEPEYQQIVVDKNPQQEKTNIFAEPLRPQISNQPNVPGNSKQIEMQMQEESDEPDMQVSDTESNQTHDAGPLPVMSKEIEDVPQTQTDFFSSFAPSSPASGSGDFSFSFFGGPSQSAKSPEIAGFNFMF